MTSKVAKLSCQQCRSRKTKCDKDVPCSACRNAGISCTALERARLPRGRSGKTRNTNTILDTRVARLECLVKQLEAQGYTNADHAGERVMAEGAPTIQTSTKMNQLVAKDFWIALSEEVTGLRETLEESDEEDILENPSNDDLEGTPATLVPAHSLLFNHHSTEPDMLQRPFNPTRKVLLHVYHTRVDCLFKALHWPTTSKAIEGHYNEPGTTSSPSLRALEFAIYFAAICSMNDIETTSMLFSDRQSLMGRYRRAAEISMTKARLLQDPDLTVLQAFVIYLLGLHAYREYATSWSLLPVAVRIANGLGLPSNTAHARSPLERELRRRVWFCIAVLDSKTSMDRGFAPMIPVNDLSNPPSITSDSELTQRAALPSTLTSNEMAFCHVTYQATICARKLCDPPTGDSSSWDAKVSVVSKFDQSMKSFRSVLDASKDPYAQFTAFAAKDIALNMHLLARRPPYRCKQCPVPPSDDFNILERTTEILQRGLQKTNDSTFAPWAWFTKAWVKWHTLAVLLAELCVPRSGDLAERAFLVAQATYSQYSELVSQPDAGMLWKPVAKLYRRVQQVRGRVPSQPSTTQPSQKYNAPNVENPFRQNGSASNGLDSTIDGVGGQTERMEGVGPDGNDSWLSWNLFLNGVNEPDFFSSSYSTLNAMSF